MSFTGFSPQLAVPTCFLRFALGFRRVQLPALLLLTLLQRMPVVRLLTGMESAWVSGSMGQLLRSSAALAVVVGAVDTLAGATTMTASPASPASATVGTTFTAAFAVTGAPSTVKSYTITNLPPGLTVTGATLSGGTFLLNASTGSITGPPSAAGSYGATITAWEKAGATGKSKAYAYTINVTGGATATAPTITTQPVGLSVTAGQAATFSVAATGTDPLTYQWSKDSVALAGATNASYAIAATTSGDAGTYTVMVSNAAGSVTSGGATLSVGAAASAPAITTQPANQSVTTGGAVTFSVAATGTAPLGYQWQKDGLAISGATSASYAIAAAAASDAGTYTVVVSNAAGSVTSGGATLSVSASASAPAITTQPASQSVTTGGAVTFSVTTTGTAPLGYQWQKDGLAISGATGASYAIAAAAASDAGTYTVVVSNAAGSVTSGGATLAVNTATAGTAPSIITQPVGLTANVGAAATFSVVAGGSAPLAYQWWHNGTALSGATGASYTLAAVTAGSAGGYTVVVTNSAGSVTSAEVMLTVNVTSGPVITNPLAAQTVTLNRSGTFTAQSFPSASYQWQVSTNAGSTWTNVTDNGTYRGAATGTLAISGATAAMNGYRYRYVVTTDSGAATSASATLTVAATIFTLPGGIGLDAAGNLYVSDSTGNNVQKVTVAGDVTLVAGASGTAGSTDGLGASARFNQPRGIAVTSAGIVYVADTANATIRRIAADGFVTTIAGSSATRGDDDDDDDGSAATFASPVGLALDSSGNLYVADAGNNTIRKVNSSDKVTTIAGRSGSTGSTDGPNDTARFNHPTGVAVDSSGNVYVADTTNNTIRRISPAGVVTTLAGVAGISGASDGQGPDALFNQPGGLAIDGTGNLYVADTGNSSIRKITPAGVVTTFAGLPTVAGFEDGTGLAALFNRPEALIVGPTGNIYVADAGNAALRVITPARVVTTLRLNPGASSDGSSNGGIPSGGGASPAPAPSGGSSGSGDTASGGGGAPSWWCVGALTLLALVRRSCSKPARGGHG